MQASRISRPLVLLLLVMLSLVWVSPASAGQPTRDPLPMPGGTLPADYCGFEIQVEFPVNREYVKTFVPKDGGPTIQMINGALISKFTNLKSGKSVEYNTSGPTKITTYPDKSYTIESSGPAAYPFVAQFDPIPGYPTFFIVWGHAIARYDAVGQLQFTTTGRIEDVCAALSN